MSIEEIIRKKNIELPDPIQHGPYIAALSEFGDNLVYVSGIGSGKNGCGTVPSEISVEAGAAAARDCALKAVSTLKEYLGDLDRIDKIVKLLVFVASDKGFNEQHLVAHGASGVLIEIFGENSGKAARSAVGVAELPLGYPVEVEMIVQLKH